MIETVFRADGVSAADRFDLWREHMVKSLCPMDMSSDHTADFRADMRLLQLGSVSVWPTTVQPVRFRRTVRLIRRSDPELYHLSLPLQGTNGIAHVDLETIHGPYDMHMVDSSRPFDIHVLTSPAPVRMVGLEVPKALLPLPPRAVDRLLARRLPAREGVGALLAGFLTLLVQDTASYGPADGPRLERVLVDLLSAVLAHHVDADDTLSPDTQRRILTLRIHAFIQQHLHDPGLTPSAIAAAHQISLSYLHRLFRTDGITVSAWVRRQRLERARRDLADPALRNLSAQRIAARWGFTHYPHFSHAFRTTYGLPPRDYRRQGEVTAPGPPGP
ncbi:helix-turn-helix domain-containing protein [Streptomyces sp. 5-6(2022)]|uniref:AraC-like ligand-binding domain-containing protein n=1 Tax=Streptomyces sp. 5-6(2022) TaxID=2936510 RepID=UPI0023B987F3|nr:helix-turn-helix domain-containing protein [Streptomyces sp. 5-6(2022)]